MQFSNDVTLDGKNIYVVLIKCHPRRLSISVPKYLRLVDKMSHEVRDVTETGNFVTFRRLYFGLVSVTFLTKMNADGVTANL